MYLCFCLLLSSFYFSFALLFFIFLNWQCFPSLVYAYYILFLLYLSLRFSYFHHKLSCQIPFQVLSLWLMQRLFTKMWQSQGKSKRVTDGEGPPPSNNWNLLLSLSLKGKGVMFLGTNWHMREGLFNRSGNHRHCPPAVWLGGIRHHKQLENIFSCGDNF